MPGDMLQHSWNKDEGYIYHPMFNRALEDMNEERNKIPTLAVDVVIRVIKGNISKSLCCRVAWSRFSV